MYNQGRNLIRNGARNNDTIVDFIDHFFSDIGFPIDRSTGNVLSENQTINVNVSENEDSYEVQASVPGFSKEEVSVDFDDNVLTISAQKNEDKKQEDDNKKWLTREFHSSQIIRRINFDNNIDSDNINAKYNDGIINLVIPKSNPKSSKKIEIQ